MEVNESVKDTLNKMRRAIKYPQQERSLQNTEYKTTELQVYCHKAKSNGAMTLSATSTFKDRRLTLYVDFVYSVGGAEFPNFLTNLSATVSQVGRKRLYAYVLVT